MSTAHDGDTGHAGAAVVLDPTALAKLQALDPTGRAGIVLRVLRTFEASLNKLMLQFDAARSCNELEGLRHVAHTLRSSSAAVGALQLSACCATVEALVRERRLDTLPAALDSMQAEGRRAGDAVRAMLDSMGPAA
jgi:HPt (histidine-containing phosphotransfer) domain-containing protein